MQQSSNHRPRLVEEGSDLTQDIDSNDNLDDELKHVHRLEVEDYNNDYNYGASTAQVTNPRTLNRSRPNESRISYRLEVGYHNNKHIHNLHSVPVMMSEDPGVVNANNLVMQQQQDVPVINKSHLSLTNVDCMAMEVDEIDTVKTPLVVIDGANIAHGYGEACGLSTPNSDGIMLAVNYFLAANMSVSVVLPTYWMRIKPRRTDQSQGNAIMETPQMESLQQLHSKGLICFSPSSDDDDAYMIHIAKNASKMKNCSKGYLVSNDLYRDAVERDRRKNKNNFTTLDRWLNSSRISCTFCNMGMDRVLFVPNPRHDLIQNIES